MATYNFTAANGSAVPSGLTVVQGAAEVQNNRLVATAELAIITQSSVADGTVSCIFNNGGSTTTSSFQLFCRWSDTDNRISALVRQSDGLVRLFRRQAGTFTEIGNVGYTIPSYSASANYKLAITTLGFSIKVLIDDVEVITATSTFNQTATTSGFVLRFINTDSVDDLVIPDAAVTDSITFNPVANFPYQALGTETILALPITWTGTPTTIEYSTDGTNWSVGDSNPTGSASVIAVLVPEGTTNVSFRFSNATGVNTSGNVIVGDIYPVIGQSNGQGALTNYQVFTPTANSTAYLFGNNDVRGVLADPYDSNVGQIDAISQDGTNGGSWVVRFAHHHLQTLDKPIGFIPNCKGGSRIDQWQKTNTERLGGLNLYESMERRINAVGGKIKGLIIDIGESDSHDNNLTTYTQFYDGLTQLITDIQASFPCKVIIRQLQTLPIDRQGDGVTTGEIAIRAAQNAVAAAMTDVYISPSMTDIVLTDEAGDGVHFRTDAEGDLVASRMFSTWSQAISSTIVITNTDTPDGTYSTEVYNTVTKAGYTENVTFSGGSANITATNVPVGTKFWYMIEGSNPPVTGVADVEVTV